MDIDLHCRLPDVDRKRLHLHLERRLNFAISRFIERIASAHIALDDVNGPRGGTDVEARIDCRLLPHGEVVVHGRYTTPEAAVDGICHRLKQALARHVDRHRLGAGDRTSMAG